MDYIAQPKDYWIAQQAINITLNALGSPNRMQCSVASGATILCYIEGIDGLGYDNGHRFRTWPLTISPTYFNSNTEKYVYVAIPRNTSVGTQAVVVFPSEKLDIYGVNESDAQVGSTDYYYIWLQGILTATDGTSNREWQQAIDFGKKGTDEDLYDDTSSDWYQYSKVGGLVTFLKNIAMKAGTTFQNLILGYKELTGVATADTAYTDSDTLVATPGYVESQYLSKTHESTAQEQIGFLKGLWIGVRNLYEITANGIAKLKSVIAEDVNAQRVQTGEIKSPNYTGDGVADTGFRLTNSHNGHSKLTIDELYVRMKAVFESLEVRERTYTGGDQIWSCAGNRITRVDYLGNVETADHVPQMMNVHADGRPEGQGQGNVYSVPVPGDTYGYSDVKVPWLLRQMPLLARAKVFARYRKVRIVINESASNSANRAAASESPLANIRRARCYFLAKDDDMEVHNWWRINDLARCQTMNLANTTRKTYLSGEDQKAGNIFWWRKVIGVSYEPVTLDDGKQYHYFDVSFDYEYEQSYPEVMATSVMEGSDIPAAQDSVVQFGNTIIEGRMNLMMMEVNGSDAVGYNPTTDAPCLKAYRGIYCFDLNKSWVGGNACKMKLSPKSGYEFYGPNFKQVTEYDVVPVPVDRGLWTDITPTRDDYREHAMVRKCYYYDKVSHNGSYWLCSIVDGAHWVDGNGDYISDATYSALTEEQKALCSRKQNYTIEEPSANSIDWTEVVKRGSSGNTPAMLFTAAPSGTTPAAPVCTADNYMNNILPQGWSKSAPNRADGYNVWMSQNTVIIGNDGTYTLKDVNWSAPTRISGDKGDPGADAESREWIYIGDTEYRSIYADFTHAHPNDISQGEVSPSGTAGGDDTNKQQDDWVPNGWSDTAIATNDSNNKFVYASWRDKGQDGTWSNFHDPILWSNWGVQGVDGDGVQYVYKLFDHELTAAERESNIPAKPDSQTQGEWIPTGWSDDPLAPTISMQYCYCSTIKKIGGDWADTFDVPGLWSRFSKDGQSAYKSTMFVRLNTTPTKPDSNKGSYANPSPSDCPAGTSEGSVVYWSDGIPSGEAQIWATSRIFTNDGTNPQQSEWSTPRPMSDTETFDVEFAIMQAGDAIPATPNASNRHKDAYPYGYDGQVWFDPNLDKYSASGVLRDFIDMYWRAERECKNGVWGDWTVIRIKGEKGDQGDKGSFKSRVFCRTNSTPDTPQNNTPTETTYNTYDNPVPPPVTGQPTWTDGIPQGTAILWSSVCTFYANGTNRGWSTPAPETDTADLDIEFSPSTSEPSVPQGDTPFADHSSEEWYDPSHLPVGQTMIWRAERKVKNGVYNGNWVITRIYGETGDAAPYYVEDYGIGASRTSHSDISSWSSSQPEPTAQKPYVWKRTRLYNPNTQTYGDATYVCLTGEKGVNGKDGWMITANPANVIITQSLSNNTSSFSSAIVSFAAKKGGTNATITSIDTPTSSEFIVSKSGNTVIVSSPKTHGSPAEYYTEGSFAVAVNVADPDTGSTVSFNVTVLCYANLLGTWKRTVEADMKHEVATSKFYFEDENGNVVAHETIGDFIKSSTENTSVIAKKISDGKNLLSGVLTGSGWQLNGNNIATDADDKFIIPSGYLVSTPYTIGEDDGYYTLSYKAERAATISFYVDGTAVDDVPYASGVRNGRRYITFNSKWTDDDYLDGALTFRFSGVSYIRHPQLEIGNVATEFTAGASETSSRIRQTVDSIELKVQESGIDINNKEVNLTAGKVNFKMPGGGTNPKISIDPTTGSLNAQDGNFSGTVRAVNLYNNLCVFSEGGDYSVYMYYCTSDYTEDGRHFYAGVYYTAGDVEGLTDIGDHFVTNTYECNIINMVPLGTSNWQTTPTGARTVTLPDPKDFEGKIIEVYSFHYSLSTNGEAFIGCVKGDSFATLLGINESGHVVRSDHESKNQITIVIGSEYKFISVKCYLDGTDKWYWLKLIGD